MNHTGINRAEIVVIKNSHPEQSEGSDSFRLFTPFRLTESFHYYIQVKDK